MADISSRGYLSVFCSASPYDPDHHEKSLASHQKRALTKQRFSARAYLDIHYIHTALQLLKQNVYSFFFYLAITQFERTNCFVETTRCPTPTDCSLHLQTVGVGQRVVSTTHLSLFILVLLIYSSVGSVYAPSPPTPPFPFPVCFKEIPILKRRGGGGLRDQPNYGRPSSDLFLCT